MPLIQTAVQEVNHFETTRNDLLSSMELFCADGYYSHYLASHGFIARGYDLREDYGERHKRLNNIHHTRLIAKALPHGSRTLFWK
jgi:hypothetical protein